MALVDCFAGWT